uniref:Uncharacterized protein n=1 Tax=Triticum urartu TaxID=4572 RepID=A0A8R7TD94_TRIUA
MKLPPALLHNFHKCPSFPNAQGPAPQSPPSFPLALCHLFSILPENSSQRNGVPWMSVLDSDEGDHPRPCPWARRFPSTP